jgi:hypothetical protein
MHSSGKSSNVVSSAIAMLIGSRHRQQAYVIVMVPISPETILADQPPKSTTETALALSGRALNTVTVTVFPRPFEKTINAS